jgi:hypothetical protein
VVAMPAVTLTNAIASARSESCGITSTTILSTVL